MNNTIICPICRRDTPLNLVEKHHLIPKCKKGKIFIYLCIDCGNQLHQLFTNKELEKQYNTLESLLSHPKIQNWIEWVNKRDFGITMKYKKKR